MKSMFLVSPERVVPLRELHPSEVMVLDLYEIEAESADDAIEEVILSQPIMNPKHFRMTVRERMA